MNTLKVFHGLPESSKPHIIITSLELDSEKQKSKYSSSKNTKNVKKEVRYEMIHCDDAEYIFVAYGSSARVVKKLSIR